MVDLLAHVLGVKALDNKLRTSKEEFNGMTVKRTSYLHPLRMFGVNAKQEIRKDGMDRNQRHHF